MDHEQSRAERPSAAERPQESGAAVLGRGGRMSRQRKRDAVLRLLRGEDLEIVSRSLGVTAATLSGWRVINAGIPGDTAEAGKQRQDQQGRRDEAEHEIVNQPVAQAEPVADQHAHALGSILDGVDPPGLATDVAVRKAFGRLRQLFGRC